MQKFKGILKIAFIYTATIIGAGFASGQEILQFFTLYGRGGFYGIIFAGILFSLIGMFVLDKVYTCKIKSYEEYIHNIFGSTSGGFVKTTATLFMFCLYCVMIAGSARVVSEKLCLPYISAVILMSLLCLFFILSNIKGIVTLSTVITPILIAGILSVCVYILFGDISVFFTFGDVSVFSAFGDVSSLGDVSAFFPFRFIKNASQNWFSSALLYVSYNSLMSVMILCSLLPFLKSRKVSILAGVAGGVLLCLTVVLLNAAISYSIENEIIRELPILNILNSRSRSIGNIYAAILWLAMLLSAVNAGFCLIQRINQSFKVKKALPAIGLSLLSVPLSLIGFSNLISGLYPIFGYAGLFMVLTIIMSGFKK